MCCVNSKDASILMGNNWEQILIQVHMSNSEGKGRALEL